MNTAPVRPVVVGIDGSDQAAAAVRYAAWEARRRHAELRLVFAHQPTTLWSPSTLLLDDYLGEQEWVQGLLESSAKLVTDGWPDLVVHAVARIGGAAGILVEESATASLVVMGTRATGGFVGQLMGSVSAQVAAHAEVPVIVLRPTDSDRLDRPDAAPVVVGVDGSEESVGALAFAAEEALARDAPLHVVLVWDLVSLDDAGPFEPTAYDPDRQRDKAERLLAEVVAGWAERHPELRLTSAAVKALDVVGALGDAARDAGLLVVGSRGHGGFLNLRLGSTADGLIRHAPVPVAVVRGRFDRLQ
jgi:nucleotide-binding universal stress UspA family protein